MKVCISSPYSLAEPKGNSVTAQRIAGLLRSRGIDARASHGFDGGAADLLVSLHAVKGANAVQEYRRAYPRGKVLVLITGTDIYQSLPAGSEEGEFCLQEAAAIVVPFGRMIGHLAPKWRSKAVVVPSSLEPLNVCASPRKSPFVISVIGHLRDVKRPFLTIEAISRHPEWREAEVWQIGQALSDQFAQTARQWEERDRRYRWYGGVPRVQCLQLCAQSHLTVNSSELEGGANAVLEAMTLGVPILASRIDGNIGLLGEDYEGYFEGRMDDKLRDVFKNPQILNSWTQYAQDRLSLFSADCESQSWLDLMNQIS